MASTKKKYRNGQYRGTGTKPQVRGPYRKNYGKISAAFQRGDT